MHPNAFAHTLATASVTDLAVMFRAAQGAVAALEAAGNLPMAEGSTILFDWQEEADGRLTEIAEEMRARVPADGSEKAHRFRCLAIYAAMVASEPEELGLGGDESHQ